MMAIFAAVIGCSASVIGLRTSFVMDTPTSPTMVCIATSFFVISSVIWKVAQTVRSMPTKALKES
jgi:zinc transport system permease protein